MDGNHIEPDEMLDAAAALTAAARFGVASQIHRLAGGGNNRAYRVEAGGRSFFLKVYFRDAADPRDRLGTEYAFSRFAWDRGVRALPEPLWCDCATGAGLYAYMEGRPLTPGSISVACVEQALDFWSQVNRHRDHAEAASLPPASEACFSITEHLNCVDRRIDRLSALEDGSEVDAAASCFVRERLLPVWRELSARVEVAAASHHVPLSEPIAASGRCLSPSDFGFHNALLLSDGSLTFHDFEYAGWDDPAKLVGDFFCQPRPRAACGTRCVHRPSHVRVAPAGMARATDPVVAGRTSDQVVLHCAQRVSSRGAAAPTLWPERR